MAELPSPTGEQIDRVYAACAALSDLPGPSGRESLVRERLVQEWSSRGLDDVVVDAVGNVVARAGGSGKRVLVVAHMDEIGFHVRGVTPDGFVLVGTMRGSLAQAQEERFPVGQPAVVLGREGVVARGILAAPSGHLTRGRTAGGTGGFFLDLGLGSREDVLALGVHPGGQVVWDVPLRRLGTRLVGKALDDRLLLAVISLLLETLDRGRLTVDLWLAGTVQEENVCHGARALAASERFDAVVALDVGIVDDVPLADEPRLGTRLGAGPILVHEDGGVAYDERLVWALVDAASRAGVPFQQASFPGYGTDGFAFQDTGSPAALVATPVRYTHTAFETAAVADVLATVDLLESFVTGPGW